MAGSRLISHAGRCNLDKGNIIISIYKLKKIKHENNNFNSLYTGSYK